MSERHFQKLVTHHVSNIKKHYHLKAVILTRRGLFFLTWRAFQAYRKQDVVPFHPCKDLVKQNSLSRVVSIQWLRSAGSSTKPTKPASNTPALGPTERKARENALPLASSVSRTEATRYVFTYKLPAKSPTRKHRSNAIQTVWMKRYHEQRVKKTNNAKSIADKIQVLVITNVNGLWTRPRMVI